MTREPPPHPTTGGHGVTDDLIDRLSAEAEADFDLPTPRHGAEPSAAADERETGIKPA